MVCACSSVPGDHPGADCSIFTTLPTPTRPRLSDPNRTQIPTARKLGIETPLASRSTPLPDALIALDTLEGVTLLPMSHSRPFVVPRMAERMSELRDRFHNRLVTAGLPAYPLVVSSALRSNEEQAALQKVNSNATNDSAHFYGTTVDLHYRKWARSSRATRVLDAVVRRLRGVRGIWRLAAAWDAFRAPHFQAQTCVNEGLKGQLQAVLAEMRREGLLWALEERKQPVFHITTR